MERNRRRDLHVGMHREAVSLRALVAADYPVARRLVASAFAGEPFAVGMFGESQLDRFAGMCREYSTWPWGANPVAVGAELAGTVVGVAVATPPGACHLCDDFDESEPPEATRAAQIEHEFQLRSRRAHLDAGLPPHAHIASVATEPVLEGCGVGRQVVEHLVARLWDAGARCAVLECLTGREQFYANMGFRRVTEFDDPGGPGLRSLLMRRDAPR